MLDGVRVLDLTRVLAGPLCTMMLGDLGADVIKVEKPPGGDETRGWGPPFDDRGESAYFLSVNRNKLSLAADFETPRDRQLIERLATEADVVVENYRPGTLERRSLGARRFRSRNTALIWCTITGFGPDSERPGYDYVVQAERGWMAITGERNGPPMKSGVALADVIAGKDAAIAILAALVARAATGRGRHLSISLARSTAAALVNVAQNALITGEDAPRWGNAHPNLVPYELFDAADRPIVIAVGTDAQWTACVRALDLGSLAADTALATNAGRLAQRERVVTEISVRLRERTAAEWTRIFDSAGVPNGLVKSVLETLREEPSSPLTGVAPSVPGSVRLPPPRLDEHGALLRELGWNAFTRMRNEG
ncbi:MAG TPA: CoA transferase [Gemmatimonadaceae bacterium]|nr:CoA transferase [Gemmatimonadaceae bacterium]